MVLGEFGGGESAEGAVRSVGVDLPAFTTQPDRSATPCPTRPLKRKLAKPFPQLVIVHDGLGWWETLGRAVLANHPTSPSL